MNWNLDSCSTVALNPTVSPTYLKPTDQVESSSSFASDSNSTGEVSSVSLFDLPVAATPTVATSVVVPSELVNPAIASTAILAHAKSTSAKLIPAETTPESANLTSMNISFVFETALNKSLAEEGDEFDSVQNEAILIEAMKWEVGGSEE